MKTILSLLAILWNSAFGWVPLSLSSLLSLLFFPQVFIKASLVAQTVKHLSAMQETWVPSPGWEDPLEKEMQPTPGHLPGKSHGWQSLGGYCPWGRKESDMTEQLHFTSLGYPIPVDSHIHLLHTHPHQLFLPPLINPTHRIL